MLSINDLNKLFQRQIISILGLSYYLVDWNLWKNGDKSQEQPLNPFYFVRTSWPVGGAPAWKQNEDVVFIKIIEIDNPINRQRDRFYSKNDDETANETVNYTIAYQLNLTIYGPNSFTNAHIIKNGFFTQDVRKAFSANKLFLVPDIANASRIPELFQGNWWERVDLAIPFNCQVTFNDVVNYIDSAKITIKNEIKEVVLDILDSITYLTGDFVLTDENGNKLVSDLTYLKSSIDTILVNEKTKS